MKSVVYHAPLSILCPLRTVKLQYLSFQIKGSFQVYYERKFINRSRCVLYQKFGTFYSVFHSRLHRQILNCVFVSVIVPENAVMH